MARAAAAPRLGEAVGELGAAALEEREARRRVEVAAERELQREDALVVVAVVVGEQLEEQLLAERGDRGTPCGCGDRSARARAGAGRRRGSPLSEPVAGIDGGAGRRSARPSTTSIAPDCARAGAARGRASRTRCPRGGRASRSAASSARSRGAAAPQQPEDRQLQHCALPMGGQCPAIVRFVMLDISIRYIERAVLQRGRDPATVRRSRHRAAPRPDRRARTGRARCLHFLRAQRHRLRARPPGRSARPPARGAHPPRRVRRPPGADAGGREHR